MLSHLQKVAETEIRSAIIRVLGKGDIIMLSGLGIDGRTEMLDVFINECQKLKMGISK
jgi:hypothetical protein